MEKLIKTLTLIATTPDSYLYRLPLLHRSLVPLLSVASSFYRFSLFLRHKLFLRQHRLPVPVISVGNLTWGGNGKTPMTEFIAMTMAELGVSPLVLTRGYTGGDEAKMLRRHLSLASVRIGIGANRRAVASSVLATYGHMDSSLTFQKLSCPQGPEPGQENEKVGIVVLDDGMQAASNFVSSFGNCYAEWLDAMGKQPPTSSWVFEGTIERTWASRYRSHSSCRSGL